MGQKDLTSPSIRICPLFDELKKGDFFYPPPSPMDQCLLLSNFFLNASLIGLLENFQIIFEFSELFQIVTAILIFTMGEVTAKRNQHQDVACGVTSTMALDVTMPDPAVMGLLMTGLVRLVERERLSGSLVRMMTVSSVVSTFYFLL